MTKERNLFDLQAVSQNSPNESERISKAAQRLTIHFTEDAKLPARYRRKPPKGKARKIKEDAKLEVAFKENVKSWTQLIETMLSKLNKLQAWRFIEMSPEIARTDKTLTECKDFNDFVDYLILRRDKEECCPDELGGLTWLLMPFQRKIEEQLEKLQASKMQSALIA